MVCCTVIFAFFAFPVIFSSKLPMANNFAIKVGRSRSGFFFPAPFFHFLWAKNCPKTPPFVYFRRRMTNSFRITCTDLPTITRYRQNHFYPPGTCRKTGSKKCPEGQKLHFLLRSSRLAKKLSSVRLKSCPPTTYVTKKILGAIGPPITCGRPPKNQILKKF